MADIATRVSEERLRDAALYLRYFAYEISLRVRHGHIGRENLCTASDALDIADALDPIEVAIGYVVPKT